MVNEIIILSDYCSNDEKCVIIMAQTSYPLLEKIRYFHSDDILEQEIIPDKYFNKIYHTDLLIKQICRQKFTMDLFDNIKSYVGDVMSYQMYCFWYNDGHHNSQDDKNWHLIWNLKNFATTHFIKEDGKFVMKWQKKTPSSVLKKNPKKRQKNKKPMVNTRKYIVNRGIEIPIDY